MTDTPPPSLRDRIEAALRAAAHDCPDDCGLTETDCYEQHPIQVSVLHHGVIAGVYGYIDAIAAAVLAIVQPELDARDAEIDRLRIAAQSAAVLLRSAADKIDGQWNGITGIEHGTLRHAATALDDIHTSS
ncbi:unknown [Streptomyces phage mu1/6]|uniref:hypothetical protein n=1 Tax=Streptomyces phage mu1/6 TaxID=370623 RepID=UPI0000D4F6C7|nr:hypothetical protein SPMV1_gp25 [Streptomyces phage mu1/6]ABD94190.1 unknown [Streptomyces phage mu1/6]